MSEKKENVLQILRNNYDILYSAEKKVVDYILEYPQEVIMMNVSELATNSSVSDATVVRMCQHAGFKGYYQMKLLMSRDLGQKVDYNKVNSKNDPIEYIFNKNLNYIQSLDTDKNKKSILKACEMIISANNVYIVAAGNTIPIALDLEFRLSRFGIHIFTSSISEQYMNYINNATKNDIVIAISKSGMSNRVNQAVDLSKKRELKIITITGDETSPISKKADCIINSGKSSNILTKIKNGLETHIGEIFIIDSLLYMLENLQNEENIYKRSEEIELETSSWKM